MSEQATWVNIGRVGRPHGIRGGIRIWLHNEDSSLLEEGRMLRTLPAEMDVDDANGPNARGVTIHKVYGDNLVTFVGVHGREAVAKFTGRGLYALREDFPEPDDDESYLIDLIGAEVRCVNTDTLFGVIESFGDNGAQPLARVRKGECIVEMPFAAGLVVDVSDDAQLVRVDAPIGLFTGDAVEATAPQASASDRVRERARRRKKAEKRAAKNATEAASSTNDNAEEEKIVAQHDDVKEVGE